MIISSKAEAEAYMAQGLWSDVSLDGMLAALAAQAPGHIAITDAPDKARFTDGPILSLTFAQANELVDALAGRLLSLGLKNDDVVAVQLGNVVENYLTLLAIMRANLIACPLPPLWRDHEIRAALAQIAPRAIITASRIAGHRHADMMSFIAAELFTIRHVLAYGDDIPDGVIGLDDVLEHPGTDGITPLARPDAANHIATITWQTGSEAVPRPVARSHNHWLAAGRMHALQADLGAHDTIFAPFFPTNMLALASGLCAWLISGARLTLYQAGAEEQLARRIDGAGATYAILPPPVIAALEADGAFAGGLGALRALGCAWPSPELAGGAALPGVGGLAVCDLYAFGEAATYAARREAYRPAGTMPLGPIGLPQDDPRGMVLLETKLGGGPRKASDTGAALHGLLHVRGPMVPGRAVSPDGDAGAGIDTSLTAKGYTATGIGCDLCEQSPPAARFVARQDGVVTVGSAAISLADLDKLLSEHSGVREAAAFTTKDDLLGQLPHAAAVPAPSGHVSLADIQNYFTARKVAPHKFPLSALAIEGIPRTQHGVTDRKVLAARMR